jgi:hypothetical protein
MTEELKAVTEVAKTTGKAIDASREVGGFISRLLSGPLEQGVGIFEDKLWYMRLERQIAIMDKFNKKMTERGLESPTQAIPMKIAIPLLQAASMEDDDNLQELWANLLVNAADKDSGVEVRHSYITILKDLTPFDAMILNRAYSNDVSKFTGLSVFSLSQGGPNIQLPASPERQKPSANTQVSIENLLRLGLLKGYQWGGSDTITGVNKTKLGYYFYKACTAKDSK